MHVSTQINCGRMIKDQFSEKIMIKDQFSEKIMLCDLSRTTQILF